MSVETNKELARQLIEEVLNGRNVEVIAELMVPGSMFAGGFEGFVKRYIQEGFPDFHLEIHTVFGEGDEVIIVTTATGTQTGTAMGRPPSGNSFSTTVVYMFKITNGRVISGQWVMDRMEMAQQLGWMPMPG